MNPSSSFGRRPRSIGGTSGDLSSLLTRERLSLCALPSCNSSDPTPPNSCSRSGTTTSLYPPTALLFLREVIAGAGRITPQGSRGRKREVEVAKREGEVEEERSRFPLLISEFI